MRFLILGVLVYMGYRLIVPRKEVHIEESSNKHLTDDEYVDYEEVE